jgi:hypothetical protein
VPAPTAKKEIKKKKINALSVDGRVLCYGGWTKEGKKYMNYFTSSVDTVYMHCATPLFNRQSMAHIVRKYII